VAADPVELVSLHSGRLKRLTERVYGAKVAHPSSG